MIKCIAVDDESVILNELCELLTPRVEIIGAFQDPYEALEKINLVKPEAVFLDIEMPGINGIELAKKIAKVSAETQIVFVTAYEQYALKAFEVSAVHYLLKPATQEKVDDAVNRVEHSIEMKIPKGEALKPSFIRNNAAFDDKISVKDRENITIIKISDIVYIKSDSGKTYLVTKKGTYSSRSGMQFWENNLKKYDFLRCHRSFIVNAEYITRMIHVLGDYKELVLDYCDINIPISRQKSSVIKSWFGIN